METDWSRTHDGAARGGVCCPGVAAWLVAMDMCKFTTKAKCRVDHDEDWKSFEAWMAAIEFDEDQ